MPAPIRHRIIGPSRRGPSASAPPRRNVRLALEALEPRLALSATATANQQGAGVIQVSSAADARVSQLLNGSFALRSLASQAGKHTSGVIVNAANLHGPGIMRLMERDYQAGDAVALVHTTAAAADSLASKLDMPPLGAFPSGVSRATLVAFREINQDGRTMFSTSVLLPEVDVTTTPTDKAADKKADIRSERAYLDGIFTATPAVPAPPQLADSAPDLLQLASAYQSSVNAPDNTGGDLQVVDTVYGARSFSNDEDLYYVNQEIDVSGAKSIRTVGGGNLVLGWTPTLPGLLYSPELIQPSPQSNPGTTTLTNSTEYNVGGSVGWRQGEGFNAEVSGGVTVANSTTTEVPPIEITYSAGVSLGDANWIYDFTAPNITAASFQDSWIWLVPFKDYAPDQTTMAFLGDGFLGFSGEPHGYGTDDKAVVPLPFGDTFQLVSPTVSGVSAPTVKPGNTFTIEGAGLYPSLIQSVLVGGQPLSPDSYSSVSDTEIQVVAPNTPGDALPVVVKTTQGISNTNVTINIKGTPVLNVQPKPIAAVAGQAITDVPVASFTDSDTDATTKDLTATITWGDGKTSAGKITADGKGTFEVFGTHTYGTAGTYTFSVQVSQGSSSDSNTGTATVSAAGRLQNLVAEPIDAVAGQAITSAPVASFTDSDPHATTSDFTATITWGDGNTSTGTITSDGKGTFQVIGANTYATSGNYSFAVQVTVRDGSSETVQGTATVSAAAGGLQHLVAEPINAIAGRAFTNLTVATFTDSDANVSPGEFYATIDWGDGYSGVTTVTEVGPGTFDVLGTHTYLATGKYAFRVDVSVNGGSTASATGTANVKPS